MTSMHLTWAHCSPALCGLDGFSCAETIRRPCECSHGGSHDHLVSYEMLVAAERKARERAEANLIAEQAVRRRLETLCIEFHEACGQVTPWAAPDLLEKLAEAAGILLRTHDYDGHGWELVDGAMKRAREMAPRLRVVLSEIPGAIRP